jgi:hypothetical protein
MRSKVLSAALGAALVISLLGATGASAATEAGNRCVGNSAAENFTVYGVANAPGDPLSATIPVNGVISRWTFNIIPVPPGFISQTLKILRATGAANQFQVIGESSPGSISGGLNNFSTRIPVHAGSGVLQNQQPRRAARSHHRQCTTELHRDQRGGGSRSSGSDHRRG